MLTAKIIELILEIIFRISFHISTPHYPSSLK